jgi:hypothetical protein
VEHSNVWCDEFFSHFKHFRAILPADPRAFGKWTLTVADTFTSQCQESFEQDKAGVARTLLSAHCFELRLANEDGSVYCTTNKIGVV